ncbi:MAG: hypothetical protein Q4P66_07140, partial [Actinomycetaceae bacterium]|nr:hypothetical protein [Actinomycetaceae bacterium]
MDVKKWHSRGIAAFAAALIAAPIALASSAIGLPSEESHSTTEAPFSDPAFNSIVKNGCYEYPELITADALVKRTDKAWGGPEIQDEDKVQRWLTVSQARAEKVAESPQLLGEIDNNAFETVNPCVVVRADSSNNYKRQLLFSTFSTEDDGWASFYQENMQSVDVFMDSVEIVTNEEAGLWVSGKVRSQIPSEFKNNVMVDAQELAELNGKTLKAPMYIDETNQSVTLHFSTPGYYAVKWTAEMNLGSKTLFSNKHLQVFRVIEADAPTIDPTVDPDPTTDPSTEPSTDPSTEPSTDPSTEPTDPDPVEPDPTTDPSTEPSTDPTTEPEEPAPTPDPTTDPSKRPTTEPQPVDPDPSTEPDSDPSTQPIDPDATKPGDKPSTPGNSNDEPTPEPGDIPTVAPTPEPAPSTPQPTYVPESSAPSINPEVPGGSQPIDPHASIPTTPSNDGDFSSPSLPGGNQPLPPTTPVHTPGIDSTSSASPSTGTPHSGDNTATGSSPTVSSSTGLSTAGNGSYNAAPRKRIVLRTGTSFFDDGGNPV